MESEEIPIPSDEGKGEGGFLFLTQEVKAPD